MMAGDQLDNEVSSEIPAAVDVVKTAVLEEGVKVAIDPEHDSLITYPTFEQPWDFSDLILNMDDRKFHVHKVSQPGRVQEEGCVMLVLTTSLL